MSEKTCDIFSSHQPSQEASAGGLPLCTRILKDGVLQNMIGDPPGHLLGQMRPSDSSLGSKRSRTEEPSEPTTKKTKHEFAGSSQKDPDSPALVKEDRHNGSPYVTPPVSPEKTNLIQAVSPKANTTSDLIRPPAFALTFEHRLQAGWSSSQDLTILERPQEGPWNGTGELFPVGAQRLHISDGIFPFTAFHQTPQQVEQSTSKTVTKTPRNTLSVADRKRFFIETPTYTLKCKLEKWMLSVYAELKVSRTSEECWLHPCPPPPKRGKRANGTITRRFSWRDGKSHNLNVNFGIVALMLQGYLTKDQKEGFITKGWHMSHLCGNWTCCNWRHHTVENGITNIKRNACFRHSRGCDHQPPCMKHLKRGDLMLVTQMIKEESSV